MTKRPDDEDPRQRANLLALVFLIALVAAAVALLIGLRHATQIQDCVLAHHRNCAPIDSQD